MSIEDTTRVAVVSHSNMGGIEEVNDFLKLGWVLIQTYCTSVGDPGERDEEPQFVLAWQDKSREPIYPPYSYSKESFEEWDSKAGKSDSQQ